MITGRSVTGLATVCAVAVMLLSACSDETAPVGSTISSPSDVTVDVAPSDAPPNYTLTFGVLDANGNPVTGVDIEFFAASTATGGSASALTDVSGTTLLNPSDANHVILQTDDRGLATVTFVIGFSTVCVTPGENLTATGTVSASVGVSSAQWTASYTVTCP